MAKKSLQKEAYSKIVEKNACKTRQGIFVCLFVARRGGVCLSHEGGVLAWTVYVRPPMHLLSFYLNSSSFQLVVRGRLSLLA